MKIKQIKNKNKILFSSLLESRIYLGTNNKSWDPKMAQYLFGVRNGFCVFKLEKTLAYLRKATKIISKVHLSKKKILFIGFPKSEKYFLIPLFLASGHLYTDDKFWFNGILTNGKHFNICINIFKEIIRLKKKSDQLLFFKKFGGTYFFKKTPSLVVIYNHSGNLEALKEASRMGIPVVSFVNSDSNPEQTDYPVPGNFMSGPAGKLYGKIIGILLKNKMK